MKAGISAEMPISTSLVYKEQKNLLKKAMEEKGPKIYETVSEYTFSKCWRL